uniref:Uncharacterized protein n=1 Tax=Anguilla anguilla TaxID=7936 RepID=A0A0E9Q3R1_ANGAN
MLPLCSALGSGRRA